jgi:hypothetical protein
VVVVAVAIKQFDNLFHFRVKRSNKTPKSKSALPSASASLSQQEEAAVAASKKEKILWSGILRNDVL